MWASAYLMSREPISFETMAAFSTPILLVDVPDAATMNAELVDVLLARKKEQSSKSHSTLGGWQSTWDIDSWAGAGTTRLLTIGSTIANRVTVDRDGKPVSINWRWNIWANINRHGHGNELHSHPGCFWSGVLLRRRWGRLRRSVVGWRTRIPGPARAGGRDVCPAPRLCVAGRLVGRHEGDSATQGRPAGDVPCLAVASGAALSWQCPAHFHCLQSQPVSATRARTASPA